MKRILRRVIRRKSWLVGLLVIVSLLLAIPVAGVALASGLEGEAYLIPSYGIDPEYPNPSGQAEFNKDGMYWEFKVEVSGLAPNTEYWVAILGQSLAIGTFQELGSFWTDGDGQGNFEVEDVDLPDGVGRVGVASEGKRGVYGYPELSSYGTGPPEIVWKSANQPPVADDQAVSTPEDTPLAITLTASDADEDDLTFSIVDGPANGTLSGTPPDVTYTPALNFNGLDSFTFKANDGQADSNTATVSITVQDTMQVCPAGMISYWKFDEGSGTAAADSYDANHGTLVGPVWTTGQVDGALSFDGNDYVDIVSSPSLAMGNSGTIEAWVQRANWNPLPMGKVVTIFTNNIWYQTTNSVYLSHNWRGDGTGEVGIHFRYGGANQAGNLYLSYGDADFWASNSWHHVAVTWNRVDSTTYLNLYADGQLVDSDATSLLINMPSPAWSIGKNVGYIHMEGWDGLIDEVAFYNQALDLAEVQQHYQNGLANNGYCEVVENMPPVAVCKNTTLELDANGQATLDPSDIDGGSYDPDGDPITLGVDRTTFTCADVGPQGITVTLTVTDDEGASTSCQATVTVVDATPPVPDVDPLPTVTGQCSATIQTAPTATDNCAGTVTGATTDPLTYNQQGTYTVTWTYDDGNGNTSSQTQTVVVDDTIAPTISVSVSPDTLWPPNHKMVKITATVTVSDNCDPDPTVVISVTSNESVNAKGAGDGNTEPDWQIDADGTVWLRAERDGKGDGRVYTITYTATDASGNSASANAIVTVPHDQGKSKGKGKK